MSCSLRDHRVQLRRRMHHQARRRTGSATRAPGHRRPARTIAAPPPAAAHDPPVTVKTPCRSRGYDNQPSALSGCAVAVPGTHRSAFIDRPVGDPTTANRASPRHRPGCRHEWSARLGSGNGGRLSCAKEPGAPRRRRQAGQHNGGDRRRAATRHRSRSPPALSGMPADVDTDSAVCQARLTTGTS